MRLFLYERGCIKESPQTVVSIDPGVKTTGVAILDKGKASIEMLAYEWGEINASKTYLPLLILFMRDKIREIVSDKISGIKGSVECVVEFPHITGEFSVGMSVSCTLWLEELFKSKNVVRVTFIQNKIPEFFLKKRSVTPLETVYFARDVLPMFVPEVPLATHAYDALLYLLFVHFDWFKAYIRDGAVREPHPELVKLNWVK